MPGSRSSHPDLRVLSVIDSLAQGGAERSLVELIGPLRSRGVDVDVAVLADRPGLRADAEAAGAAVWSVEGGGGSLGTVARLRGLVRDQRPDLVHTTLFGSAVTGRPAARLANVPVVTSLVNTPYGPDHRAEPGLSGTRVRLAQVLDAATARLVRRFHANAVHVADTMASRLAIPRGRIDVIHRGRDPDALGSRSDGRRDRVRGALAARIGDLGSDPIVLAVTREEHQKGLDVLIDAVSSATPGLERVRLVVAGREGNATPRLRRQVTGLDLDDRVHFLGFRRDVGDLLAAADVFVLPSRREGFPGVVIEAMALSVPIVATDLPGTREALGDGVGVLVPTDDPARLARAIAESLTDRARAEVRARRGRDRFLAEFTIEIAARRMAGFFRRASGRSQ